jgi:RNA polymerase sigma-70 factor (ECF subfamily)
MSLTYSEIDAADLVQETFLVWAKKGHQLQQASKVRSWLFTTLHRKFLESRRRITRFPHLGMDDAEAELPVLEPVQSDRVAGSEILECLRKVDPQFQAAVALFYLEDYTYPEIAEILEIPLGTVKSRIARGVAQLKGMMWEKPRPHA